MGILMPDTTERGLRFAVLLFYGNGWGDSDPSSRNS
jgi:hypothetical protein